VVTYLRSKSWETRIAASKALAAIASAVHQWDPPPPAPGTQHNLTPFIEDGLTFDNFDINSVIEKGVTLLASGGKEFDIELEGLENLTPSERMERRRKMVRMVLGDTAAFMDGTNISYYIICLPFYF